MAGRSPSYETRIRTTRSIRFSPRHHAYARRSAFNPVMKIIGELKLLQFLEKINDGDALIM
jgi:hypothetical protein